LISFYAVNTYKLLLKNLVYAVDGIIFLLVDDFRVYLRCGQSRVTDTVGFSAIKLAVFGSLFRRILWLSWQYMYEIKKENYNNNLLERDY